MDSETEYIGTVF